MITRIIPVLDTSNLQLRHIYPDEVGEIAFPSGREGEAAGSLGTPLSELDRIAEEVDAGRALHWGIRLKAEGRLIGTCGFYRGFEGRRGEIGYVMNPEYRRRGLMKEAISAIVAYGFDKLGLLEIVAYTERRNLASIRLLEKLDFEWDVNYLNTVLVKFSLRNPNIRE